MLRIASLRTQVTTELWLVSPMWNSHMEPQTDSPITNVLKTKDSALSTNQSQILFPILCLSSYKIKMKRSIRAIKRMNTSAKISNHSAIPAQKFFFLLFKITPLFLPVNLLMTKSLNLALG